MGEGRCLVKNIDMQVQNNILTIKIDLSKEFGESKSGKTIIVATSAGNINVPDNDGIKLGINCYKAKA